jgi:hypothetical protein
VFAMLMCVQTTGKKLGKIAKQLQWHVLQSRLDIEQTRLLVLNAAHQLDLHGNKVAKGAIAMAKVKHRPTSYVLCSNCATAESTLCFLNIPKSLGFLRVLVCIAFLVALVKAHHGGRLLTFLFPRLLLQIQHCECWTTPFKSMVVAVSAPTSHCHIYGQERGLCGLQMGQTKFIWAPLQSLSCSVYLGSKSLSPPLLWKDLATWKVLVRSVAQGKP